MGKKQTFKISNSQTETSMSSKNGRSVHMQQQSESMDSHSSEDVISTKFEQIMEITNIPLKTRNEMRKFTEDKKIQLIMQHEFAEKSNFLKRNGAKIVKKKRRSFKLGSKYIF